MSLQHMQPGELVEIDTVSENVKLELKGTARQYPFAVTSAPPIASTPADWRTHKKNGVVTVDPPIMVVPYRVTISVLFKEPDVAPAVEVASMHGHRILKSGEISTASGIEVHLPMKRVEWPEWLLSLITQFGDGDLA